MSDQQESNPTVAELIQSDNKRAARALVQIAAGVLIAIGLLFTGYMNFMLYSRAFPDSLKIMGLIPALLIEGSLAVFLLGSFVWFSHGVQGILAKIFGWLMFAIVGLNTVIEFNALVGNAQMTDSNEFLRMYAFWGTPLVLVLVIGFWKAVIDTDPAIHIMRQQRQLQQVLTVAKIDATLRALGREQSRAALGVYGNREADHIDRILLGVGESDPKTTIINQPDADQTGLFDRARQHLADAIAPTPAAPSTVTFESASPIVPPPEVKPDPKP